MRVIVEVVVASAERPPRGARVRVEARDTSLADAPSETVASADGVVREDTGAWLETVELDVVRRPDASSIWAHVDVDGDGRVSIGDYVTMASHPLPAADGEHVSVVVRRV